MLDRFSTSLHLVEIACGGWGNPAIPENIEDLLDYFSTFSPIEEVPAWIFLLVEKLIKIDDFTSRIAKLRAF